MYEKWYMTPPNLPACNEMDVPFSRPFVWTASRSRASHVTVSDKNSTQNTPASPHLYTPPCSHIFLISFTNGSLQELGTRVFEVGFRFSTSLTSFSPFPEDATIRHYFYGVGVDNEWGNFCSNADLLLRASGLYVNLLHRKKFR
jgi:hypothetical protein